MKPINVARLVKPNIRSLSPYKAEETTCKVKLDANESPYGLPIGMLKADLNRYPDPEAKALKKAIAKDLGVRPDNILMGNGSDELIYYLIMTFGGPVLYPTPTFSMYGIIAQALGESFIGIPLDKEFDLDANRILAAVKKGRPKLIFLSSPNNPTGNCFSADRILGIIEASKGVVVVDEAYQAFAGERGFLPLLEDYENLVVLRTMSKIGLAAIRTGFLIGRPELVSEVNKVRLPFNLNSLSQTIAYGSFKNKQKLREWIRTVVSERARVFDALTSMEGVIPYPSEANFILFRVESANKVYKGLLKQDVLVRNMDQVIKGALRVTIGKPEENSTFLRALSRAVGGI
jgi:histidinol-phosphate aminotransferase